MKFTASKDLRFYVTAALLAASATACSGGAKKSATAEDVIPLEVIPPSEVIGVNTNTLNRVTVTGAGTLHRSQCGSFNVALTDVNGATVNADADLLVTLSGAGAGAYYSDATCTTPSASVTVTTGASTAPFYFRADSNGTYNLTPAASSHDAVPVALVVSPAPAAAVAWSGPASSTTVSCATLQIQLRDIYTQAYTATAPTLVNLDDGVAPGNFYSDAACATPATSVTVDSGASSATIYYRQTSTGSAILNATSSGLTAANHTLTINAAPPTQLSMSGSATLTTVSCSPYSVRTRDAMSVVANAIGNVTVALDPGAGAGEFYSDSGCTTSVTEALITAGTNSVTVYFKQPSPAATVLTASSAGLTDGSLSITVNPAPANTLTMAGATSITTVQCSAYVITSRDAANLPANVPSTVAISLSDGGAGGDFYTASNCAGASATSSTTINTGANSVTVYYKKTVAGPASLEGSASGFSPALLAVSATQGPATTLSFSANPATPVDATTCVEYTITLQDAYGNVANAPSALTINLSGQGTSGNFYGTTNCSSSAVTTRSIASGTSSVTLSYRKTVPGAVTLTAARAGMSTALRDLTVVNAPATKIVYSSFTTPTSPNVCRSLQVQLRDVYNNAINATSPVQVDLTDASGTGTFHTNSTCTAGAQVTSVNIATGANTVTYYYKRATGGTVALGIASTGLTGASSNMVISSGTADRLVWTTAPTATPQNVCTAFGITTRDEQNLNANVSPALTISLTGLGADGLIYSNSSCTTQIANPVIPNNTATVTFYYRKASTGSVTLAAAASGYTGANRAVTVSSGVVTNLAFSGGPTSVAVNACSSVATVISRDEAAVQRNVTSATTVALTDGGAGGTFYSNSTCTAAITDRTIASGASSTTFYYRRTTTGAVTLRAEAAGLTAATRAVSVTTGAPAALAFSVIPPSVEVDDCAGYTVVLKDSGGNTVNAPANRTVNLSTTLAGATVYADSNCTLVAPSVLIAAGSNNQQFFVQPTAPGSGDVVGASSGLTGVSEPIDVP